MSNEPKKAPRAQRAKRGEPTATTETSAAPAPAPVAEILTDYKCLTLVSLPTRDGTFAANMEINLSGKDAAIFEGEGKVRKLFPI